MGISVGALNVLINIGILVLAAISEHVLSRAIGNYSRVELFNRGKAKVVHDSDTQVWYFPVSIMKYRNNLGVLLAIITAFSLVVAEILSEFGVDSSQTCGPQWVPTTSGICARDYNDKGTSGEVAGISLFNQRLRWADETPIEEFYEGFSKDYDGTQCTSCGGRGKPALVSGCSVERVVTSSSPDNSVAILKTEGAFGTIAANLTVDGVVFDGVEDGAGDLTCNGAEIQEVAYCSLFTVTYGALPDRTRANEIYLVTYYNNTHIRELIEGNDDTDVAATARGPITIDALWCQTNAVTGKYFAEAVQIYRSMQLEQSGSRYPRDPRFDGPQLILPRDIVMAVFGIKVVDEEECEGYTAQFSECGVYNPIFLAPLAAAIAVSVLLIVVSRFLVKGTDRYSVPRSSRTWYAFVKYLRIAGDPLADSMSRGDEKETYRDWFHWRSYFHGLDDAILLDLRRGRASDGEDSAGQQDVGIEFGQYSAVRARAAPWRVSLRSTWDMVVNRASSGVVPGSRETLSTSPPRSNGNSDNWNPTTVPL